MILGAAWAPVNNDHVFATSGRDKSVRIWQKSEETFVCKTTVALTSAVSAIAFLSVTYKGSFILAVGEDTGVISIHRFAADTLEAQHVVTIEKEASPSRLITQLSWRPVPAVDVDSRDQFELAVASEDTSIRIYAISNMLS
jgi:elongator complex protein 2